MRIADELGCRAQCGQFLRSECKILELNIDALTIVRNP